MSESLDIWVSVCPLYTTRRPQEGLTSSRDAELEPRTGRLRATVSWMIPPGGRLLSRRRIEGFQEACNGQPSKAEHLSQVAPIWVPYSSPKSPLSTLTLCRNPGERSEVLNLKREPDVKRLPGWVH